MTVQDDILDYLKKMDKPILQSDLRVQVLTSESHLSKTLKKMEENGFISKLTKTFGKKHVNYIFLPGKSSQAQLDAQLDVGQLEKVSSQSSVDDFDSEESLTDEDIGHLYSTCQLDTKTQVVQIDHVTNQLAELQNEFQVLKTTVVYKQPINYRKSFNEVLLEIQDLRIESSERLNHKLYETNSSSNQAFTKSICRQFFDCLRELGYL